MRFTGVRLGVIVCLFLALASAWAQQPTGSISGIVADPTGAVVAGAGVTVTNKATGVTIALKTSSDGSYTVGSLLPGAYEVRIEAPGFKTTVLDAAVRVGSVTPGSVQLAVGATAETVTVEAEAVTVNPTQTTLQGVITSEQIRSLPLNGRNFLDLGQLEPGVQIQDGGNFDPTKSQFSGLSIGSQSGRTTRITVDGVDISDETVGTTTQNISQDSIQEFQISRSALDLSTGLTGTGAVNIVTKSGGNDVHGSGFFFLRTQRLTARIGPTRAPFDREQVGFNVGGPFVRDKLFWFVNYERNNQDGAIATNIGGFPQFNKTWAIPFDERMVTGRVDWNVTPRIRAFYRFTHNFNNAVATGGLGFGGKSLAPFSNKNNTNQSAAGFDATLGRFTHSFRYGFLNFNNFIVPAGSQIADLPQTLDPGGRPLLVGFGAFASLSGEPQVGPNFLAPQSTLQDNHEFRYDGSLTLGRHVLRWGGLVNVIRMNVFASFWGVGPEIDLDFTASNQAVCGSNPLCFPVVLAIIANGLGSFSDVPTLGFPFGGAKNTRFHWYVGDTWRATRSLTLNYGVRYVYEPGQNNPNFKKPAALDAFLPGLARPDRRDKNNFGPYLGLAWKPTASEKWVVRAGAGLFYDANIFNNSLFERAQLLPPGVSFDLAFPPLVPVRDPVTGRTIFDMSGSDPTALITPGRNWISGCRDPRFPGGDCPLGTPGLIDAVLAAFNAFKAASLAAAAKFPSGPTIFEVTRTTAGNIFDPNYKTPYSFQLNAGVQRELRPGLVLSADYLRNRGVHYILRRDANRLGAADSLNVANARAAVIATHAAFGCPAAATSAAVNCAIAAGATIEDYAANGLGSAGAASPGSPNPFAFPGLNPNFNSMQLLGMQGLSTYNGLQVSLRGRLPNLRRVLRDWTAIVSYSLSRLEGTSDDQAFLTNPVNNDNILQFFGPSTLDRRHMLSIASLFTIPGGIHLNSIWRVNSRLPKSIFVPQVSGSPAEIFFTDFNGDGTVGDPLPATNRGSFGRGVKNGKALNSLIANFNGSVVGTLTPAAKALVSAGLFTEAQLKALGAVANGGSPITLAPSGQVNLDSFITTDVRISRPFKFWGERITAEPAFELFNVFNIANYDLGGNTLSALLTGTVGSINGTTAADRPNRAGFGSGSFSQGIPRSWQLSVRVSF